LLEYSLSARYLHRLVRPVGDQILRVPSLRRAALSSVDWAGAGDEGLLDHLASVLVQESMRRERFLLDERLLVLRPNAALAVSAIARERALAFEDASFLERLDLAIFVKPDETAESYLLAAAEVRAKAGRLADAEDLLWRATASPAGAYQAAERLIDLLLNASRPEEALSRLGAMEQGKRLPAGEIEFLRGRVHERGGRLQAALASYVLAAQYRPDDVDTLVATALVAHRVGRSDLALQYARRAREAGRADSDVPTRLAPLWGP
jgi:tetratricopeptide (TPR) repeat protein